MPSQRNSPFPVFQLARQIKKRGDCGLASDVTVTEMRHGQLLVRRGGFAVLLTSYDINPEEVSLMKIYNMINTCRYGCRRSCVLLSGIAPDIGE